MATASSQADGCPMPTSRLDPDELARLLRSQDGLITLDQARGLGLSPAALTRRIQSPTSGWSRVLPRVYHHGVADLTERQRSRAASLFAGPGAVLTGVAALRWLRIRQLPDELHSGLVDVVVRPGRQLKSREWVGVHRSGRSAAAYSVDGVLTMPVSRAVVDAVLGLPYEATLALLCVGVNDGRTSPDQLRAELISAPTKGSMHLRAALAECDLGSRSVPEAQARRLFRDGGLPPPMVNVPLTVGDVCFVPDFRWGRVIVEIDSKAWHLLSPGSWERTIGRRAMLTAHGYLVFPFTPEQIRDSPELVLATVRNALADAPAP